MTTTNVTADANTLMKQAGYTAQYYLSMAIGEIDKTFGEGYAKSHPELIAAFMKTAASDYISSSIQIAGQNIQNGLEYIGHSIDVIK